MAIVRTGTAAWELEEAKWNTPRSQGGMRPDTAEYFPTMLYMARRHSSGKWLAHDAASEQFSASCQLTVRNEHEKNRAWDQGWRGSPTDAEAYHEQLEQEMAQAAAEAAHSVQRMSGQAQAEFKAAEDATDKHVADVPAPKRRGRPRKVVAAA
jgi:hypothetical protein